METKKENVFPESLKVLDSLFSKDCQFALATSENNIPQVRYIDAFYNDGCFYIVTYGTSKKVKDIEANPQVALVSHRLHRFLGVAKNIGHPLQKENTEIRAMLLQAFEKWYFLANDEKDPKTCYIQIRLTEGFFYHEGFGYQVDFVKKTATRFPFRFDITVID